MNRNPTSTRLFALCSAAVVCVASYAVVESASGSSTHAQNPANMAAARHSATQPVVAQTTKAKATTAVKKPASKQKYKDGTYTGVGNTHIGAVQVAVTLKHDKFTNVQITGFTTHYPIGYIDPVLPQELMARQNINQIDVVSGATLSTTDFYYAVVSCLQQAARAEKAGAASQNHA